MGAPGIAFETWDEELRAMTDIDTELRRFVSAIVLGDAPAVSALLAASPQMARARFVSGATRQAANSFFLDRVERYIVAGDSALHIGAAVYEAGIIRSLLHAGADVHAQNRFGDQPLHAAAVGNPNSPRWNPVAQAATIEILIEAGADPNAADKRGVTPLHKAVRTRCAAAVHALLERGADPAQKNKSGSTPMLLAIQNTGRGGTGTPEAKDQQQQILRLLEERTSAPSR